MRGLSAPLAGTRVVDLTRVLAGPYATMLLAEMGADVIKIESPTGDESRRIPPMMDGESSYFRSVNSGKRSVVIDLTAPDGRRILHELVGESHVVVESFRPATAAKLGADYETLRRVNPEIVVCSISGFGRGSSLEDAPAYDLMLQARAGMMAVTGHEGGAPTRLGVPAVDLAGGMNGAIGILAALHAATKEGSGRHVDVALFDGALSLLSYMAGAALNTGVDPGRVGSGHHSLVPYGAYRTRDGWLVLAVLGDKFWPRLCEALQLREFAADPSLELNQGRLKRREEIDAAINRGLESLDQAEALTALEAAGVPSAPLNSVLAALKDPLTLEREMVKGYRHPAGDYRVLRSPIRVLPEKDRDGLPAPALGQHTLSVLREVLDCSAAQLEDWMARGVISSNESMTERG